MSFSIDYDKQAQDFLRKAEKLVAKRILDKIDQQLLENPVSHGVKAIVGEHGVFRIRIGDFRALYRIDYSQKKIIIFKIEKRSKVYD